MKINDLNIYAKLYICNELLDDIQNITDDRLEKLVYTLKSLNVCDDFNISKSDKTRIKMIKMYENEFNKLNDAELNTDEFIKLINTNITNVIINNLSI